LRGKKESQQTPANLPILGTFARFRKEEDHMSRRGFTLIELLVVIAII